MRSTYIMLTGSQKELLAYYQEKGDRIITVIPNDAVDTISLVVSGYLERVENEDGIYQVRNVKEELTHEN